jgi:hypothetical protein
LDPFVLLNESVLVLCKLNGEVTVLVKSLHPILLNFMDNLLINFLDFLEPHQAEHYRIKLIAHTIVLIKLLLLGQLDI